MAKKISIKLLKTNLELFRCGLKDGDIIQVDEIDKKGKAWVTTSSGDTAVIYPEDYQRI